MAYTDQQIKNVCDKATDVLHTQTDAQNVTFPTTAIIEGMKAGLSADVIANNARASIEGLPMYNNGTRNSIGFNDDLFNLASFMRGVVYKEIKALEDAASSEEQQEEQPKVTITSVTLNKNATSIAKGGTETLTATVVASPDESANKTVTWSLEVANEKVTVVDGVVTVANDAETGDVTVIATSTVDDTKHDSCIVTITE